MTIIPNLFIQLNKHGTGTITLQNEVSTTTTVKELKQKLIDREGGRISGVILTYMSQVLHNDQKTLGDYKIRNLSTIFAAYRLLGGVNLNEERITKQGILLSTIACPLALNDSCNSTNTKRMHFPTCKKTCYICYSCLKYQVLNAIKINGDTAVPCPFKCGDYDLDHVFAALDFSENEEKDCLQKLGSNCLKYSNIKPCPNNTCSKYVWKAQNLMGYRVKCPLCKYGDYCFLCDQKWKTEGYSRCGNELCDYESVTIKLLNNCNTRDYTWNNITIQNIPILRLCPMCKTPFEWESQCKHITCVTSYCGHGYCQSCLKRWGTCKCRNCNTLKDKNYCSLGIKCVVAPIQKIDC